MRLRTQFMVAIFATGCLGVGALLVDRMVTAWQLLEHRSQMRAAAIGEAVEILVRDDMAAGSWRGVRDETRALSGLPGLAYFQIFDKNGNMLIPATGREKPVAGGEDSGGTIESRRIVVAPDTGKIIGFVKVGLRKPDLRKNLRPLLLGGIELALATILLLTVVAYLLGRSMARRLDALADVLGRTGGSEPVDLPDRGTDSELDRLARSFNSLHARLRIESERRAKLESLKQDLTDMLVHDMKHPITVLKVVLTLIEERESSQMTSEEREYLMRMAGKVIAREDAMIEELLQLARLNNAEMPVRFKPIPLAEFLSECAETNGAITEASERRWEYQIADDVRDGSIVGDIILLKRVVGNLVLNAIEHTPERSLISLCAELSQEDRSQIEMSVRDEGTGVPAAWRDSIFEKYVTFAETARNVGLGLAFCKMVAEKHSGRLILRSEPGKGATFSLLLPIYKKGVSPLLAQTDSKAKEREVSKT